MLLLLLSWSPIAVVVVIDATNGLVVSCTGGVDNVCRCFGMLEVGDRPVEIGMTATAADIAAAAAAAAAAGVVVADIEAGLVDLGEAGGSSTSFMNRQD